MSLYDGVYMPLGNYFDISELMILSDSFLAEYLGASLFALLCVHPFVIAQLWRLIHLLFKHFNNLGLSNTLPTLSLSRLKFLEHSAHGCRAPPF